MYWFILLGGILVAALLSLPHWAAVIVTFCLAGAFGIVLILAQREASGLKRAKAGRK
jgi:hypothetical protein